MDTAERQPRGGLSAENSFCLFACALGYWWSYRRLSDIASLSGKGRSGRMRFYHCFVYKIICLRIRLSNHPRDVALRFCYTYTT